MFVSTLHYPTRPIHQAQCLRVTGGMLKCLVLLPLIITSDIAACIHLTNDRRSRMVKERRRRCRLQLFLVFHTPLQMGQFGRLLNDSLPSTLPAAGRSICMQIIITTFRAH